MNLILLKNNCANVQGKIKTGAYCKMNKSLAFFAEKNQECIFRNDLCIQEIYMSRELFKIHCGKTQADFGRRSASVYMSFSKSVQQRSQNGIFNGSPLPGVTC